MNRSIIRPVSRALRATPVYPRIRRRVITRLRASSTARRVARSTFPDLLDEQEATKRIKRAVGEAVAVEQKVGAAAQQSQIDSLRQRHAEELSALKGEHKEKMRRAKADFLRKEEQKRRAKPAVSAGNLVAGFYLGDRPLLVFDVRGLPLATAEATIEEIAIEQVLGCGYRPMFIVDDDDPSVWHRYGHLTETLPAEQGWQGATPYAEYLAQRIESIRADLDARWYLTVPPTGLTETQRAFLRRCGR